MVESILSEKYMIDVLLFLNENGPSVCDSLSDIVKSARTKEILIRKMRAAQLIEVNLRVKLRRTYSIEITELGRLVAADLKCANDRLQGIASVVSTNHGSSQEETDSLKRAHY